MPGNIVFAGGSGELGSALRLALAKLGYTVVVLSRNPKRGENAWDGRTLGDWTGSLEGAEAVVNLAGRSIDCRFTPENRLQILESRVDSTRVIGEAIAACKAPPKVWLQASAIGVYGEGGEQELDEGAVAFPSAVPNLLEQESGANTGPGDPPDPLTPVHSVHGPSPTRGEGEATSSYCDEGARGGGGWGWRFRNGAGDPLSRFASLTDLPLKGGGGLEGPVTDFMATSCRLWEAACAEAETPNARKVILRTAVVLSPHSGAYPKLWRLAKLGLGGAAGSGGQFLSWIHVDDWVRAVLFLMDLPCAQGPFNLASPTPVRNKDLMAALRKAARRPWSPPVPAPLLRIGSALMGTEADLILQSQRVFPGRLKELGFEFDFPTLEAALEQLTSTRG